jgi:hypothetical protein
MEVVEVRARRSHGLNEVSIEDAAASLDAIDPDALKWNDSVGFGERARLARTGRRPADQIKDAKNARIGQALARGEAIGETPMAATETVALPVSTESFRLKRPYWE